MCLLSLLLCKEEGSSPVSLQLLRGGIWVSLSMSLLGFGMGTMLANFHVWYYVDLKCSFQHSREDC